MRRPLGVTLSSIVLGLCAAFALLLTASTVFLVVYFRRLPVFQGRPGPPPGVFIDVFLFLGAIFLIVAVWAAATLYGLLKLRSWARYSIVVIGGLLTSVGGVLIVGCVFLALAPPTVEAPLGTLPRSMMQAIFAIESLFYAAVAALGIWWLVYFNLRNTKVFFLSPQELGYAQAQSLSSDRDAPQRFEHVPAAIIVLACLFCISALCCLLCAFLPLPAFLFGAIVTGRAVPILYVTFSLIAGLLGFGLFRLDNRARIATYILTALGTVNLLLIFTPWYRNRMTLYVQQIYREQGFGIGVTQSSAAFYSGPMLAVSAVFGIAVCGVIVWILYRYRRAFTHQSSLRSAVTP